MGMMILAFGPLFAFLDRWSGGGVGWEKLKLPGRPIYYAAALLVAFYVALATPAIISGVPVLMALTMALTGLPALAVAGVAFLFWRSPAWSFLGGTTTPRTDKEWLLTFLRHLIVVVPLAAAYFMGFASAWVILAGVAFAVAATAIADAYAREVDAGRDNYREVELKRGLVFGILIGAALAIPF